MNIIEKFLKNILLALESLFWKKDNTVILFGAWFGEKFADNSRYLFQYLSENRNKLGLTHVVWVTQNEKLCNELMNIGYEACIMGTKESIYYHKRAGFHIICNSPNPMNIKDSKGDSHTVSGDIEGKYSFRAKRINLWHGTGGAKAVGLESNAYRGKRDKHKIIYSIKEFILYHSKFFQRFFIEYGGWGYCYQFSTSPTETLALYRCGAKSKEMYIETSYPRNCVCPRLLQNEEEILCEMKKYNSTILFLPTFRTNSSYQYYDFADELKDILEEKNILWIEKLHTAEKSFKFETINEENIVRLDPDFDINVLMPHITMLITDYSSARMDAMFHNKAVLFFVPDFEEYKNGDNGFAADQDEIMCGPRFFTIEELREGINRFILNPEASKTENYIEIKERYWSTNHSLDEIWEDILVAIKR